MAGIKIADAQTVGELKLSDKFPISDGSGQPMTATIEQVKTLVGGISEDELDKKQDKIEDLDSIRNGANRGSTTVQPESLSNVATSGLYNDLKDKPHIPDEVTERTVSVWGFTKNKGTYIKPSTGIPKSDLDSDVIASLNKANSALQSHQSITHLATKDEVSNKQDVITDIDIIREGSSLGATALQSVPEEYITDTELGVLLDGKVDKVDGKQLSTEDFTKVLKEKLESLKNYDDSDINSAIDKLRTDFDTLVGGDTSSAIESFNEIIAFLEGVEDSDNLDSIIASIEQQIVDVSNSVPTKVSELANDKGYLTEHQDLSDYATKKSLTDGLATKQDVISDIDTIRNGAAKGASALQSVPSGYVTETELSGKGYATTTSVNAGLATKQDTISDLSTIRSGAAKGSTALQSIPSNITNTLSALGTLYKANWIAEKTTGISQKYTDILTLPAGTYILSVVLPYASVGHGNKICIGFSAKVAIGVGNTFLDASYGCCAMLATFETTTNLCVTSAASNNSAEWAYLDRGGLAALRII